VPKFGNAAWVGSILCSYGRRFTSSPLAQNRRNILTTPPIHETFLRFGQEGPSHGAWVGAYVIMPDHLHLFVATNDEQISISAWMKSLKNTTSKTLSKNRVTPSHWQKTFFDHLLRSSELYYVRENPVLAGLVASIEDWPYLGEIFTLEYSSGK
jgi:REP element-mobilizing transposase RayT